MITKDDLIKQCKAENPKMVQIVNDEEIELSKEQYDKAANDWAEMRLEQIANEQKEAAKAEGKAVLLAKLGITAEEAALLLG